MSLTHFNPRSSWSRTFGLPWDLQPSVFDAIWRPTWTSVSGLDEVSFVRGEDGTYRCTVDVGSVPREHVKVTFDKTSRLVNVTAKSTTEKRNEHPTEQGVVRSFSSSTSNFSYSFRLPDDADPTTLLGRFETGRMTVLVKGTEPAENPELTHVPVE